MSENVVSYAKKYFGLDYESKPFCEADSLILSQIVYYNYAAMNLEEDFRDRLVAEDEAADRGNYGDPVGGAQACEPCNKTITEDFGRRIQRGENV